MTKATTETITNDAVTSDDAELKFSVAANTTYRFRIVVFYTSGSAAGDFKGGVNGPASPTLLTWGSVIRPAAAVPTISGVTTGYSAPAFGGLNVGNGSDTIDGIVQNGVNAGTVAFQWAQNASNAAATSVLKGSYIEYSAL